ncbi:hypothetical protein BDZ94DRAFT_1258739 [Collybia nuda]|uniref:Uncharacterized protein n=1 Tax=Collybia nuda TaxID=64659 RepID=A0A9P5Y950_9AGAR|nr:hypothetical protein BDZ94DRAFT_1258739 [Collybia nuda]
MHLYLSKHSPLDSAFATDDGQVMFKVDTEPIKAGTRTSYISCAISNDIPRRAVIGEDIVDTRERFGSLGQIEFNTVASSVIRFQGAQVETKEYFRKDSWGPYGR